ncbi:hypothetical protein RR48_01084 [Papilio machaon]|uniref:Uncharacterized protein n=1 Tax=Papilio machaon TaxID=76193 RepID=A0A0N0PB58_PAPMA|nr:hypothetical protein RR48_01084 [Papilio machaon]
MGSWELSGGLSFRGDVCIAFDGSSESEAQRWLDHYACLRSFPSRTDAVTRKRSREEISANKRKECPLNGGGKR